MIVYLWVMTQKTQRPVGTVRVDERGRVYLRRLAQHIPPGTYYVVETEHPVEPEAPPKTIRMRLVEPARDPLDASASSPEHQEGDS